MMNYKNLAKLCREEANTAFDVMTGNNNESDIVPLLALISRLIGILLTVAAVLDDGDDNKSTINYRNDMMGK